MHQYEISQEICVCQEIVKVEFGQCQGIWSYQHFQGHCLFWRSVSELIIRKSQIRRRF